MHRKNIVSAGAELKPESKVLILLHGRGGRAEDVLSLSSHLAVDTFTLLAPQATAHTWYPYSFLAPPSQNEPWLSSALHVLKELIDEVQGKGVPSENIYLLGFSQGACLTLEFAARNAQKYGGMVAFTGGLIGDRLYPENYKGDFESTPVFIGTGHPDPHVPVERVHASANVLKSMNATVTVNVYEGLGHTVHPDELRAANELVFRSAEAAFHSASTRQA